MGGLVMGVLAQATSITVAVTCSSAMVECAGLVVMRSHAGRNSGAAPAGAVS